MKSARYSMAPEEFCLVLLPSRPDTIRKPSPHWAGLEYFNTLSENINKQKESKTSKIITYCFICILNRHLLYWFPTRECNRRRGGRWIANPKALTVFFFLFILRAGDCYRWAFHEEPVGSSSLLRAKREQSRRRAKQGLRMFFRKMV